MRTHLPRQSADRGRRGQAIVVTALAVATLFGFAGLVFDGGVIYMEKRRMQGAADAGAITAAWEVFRRNTDMDTQIRPAALNDTGLNGYGEANTTIYVNNPPASGPNQTNEFVEVIIEQDVPTSFMGILNFGETTVRARSVAGAVPYIDFCVLALDPTAPAALNFRGTVDLVAECGAMSNSADPCGFQIEGDAVVEFLDAGVTGGYCQLGTSSSMTPPPLYDTPPALDPFSYLVPPDYSTWPAGFYNAATQTYKCPGGQCVYDATIDVAGPPGNKTFEPGFYVLRNGFDIRSTNVVTGTDVTFYNLAEGGQGFRIAGQADVTFAAPTSGDYKGILLWSEAPDLLNDLGRGGSSFQYRGSIYLPYQRLSWEGTSFGANPWGMVVARMIDWAGTEDFVMERPPPDEAPDVRRVMLVE